MPIKNRFILLYILAVLLPGGPSMAQQKGQSQLNLGYGLVSPEQLYMCTNSAYASIPYAFTGAIFLNYRQFLTDHFAIGFDIGIDNAKGDLTFGRYVEGGAVGTYVDNTFTVAAPELYIKYKKGKHSTCYGSANVGFTFSRIEKAYNPTVFSRFYYNGQAAVNKPYDLPPVNPYYSNDSYINGQLTFLGIRKDGKVAWFIEFGFGYKGLIHSGISLNL